MNWFIIFSISFLIILISAPLVWLAYKMIKNNELSHDSLSRIRLIKELEMIESIYEKHSKN